MDSPSLAHEFESQSEYYHPRTFAEVAASVIQRLFWFLRTIVDLFYCLSYVVSNLWVFRYTGSISSNFKHTNQFVIIWRSFIQISCVRAFAYCTWVGRFECAAKYGASILGSTKIVRNSHARSL